MIPTNTGTFPRELQLGLDKNVSATLKELPSTYQKIFKTETSKKAYVEAQQLSGMGPAAPLDEGAMVELDSMATKWVFRWPMITYAKGARVTHQAILYNQYADVAKRLGKNVGLGLGYTRDQVPCNILNRFVTSGYTGPDGSVLCSASGHTLRDGTANPNRPAVDFDLCEDGIEQLVQLIDGLKGENGQPLDIQPNQLIIPYQRRQDAERLIRNPNRPATADRDINATYQLKSIKDIIVWKRLTSAKAHFITTDIADGLAVVTGESLQHREMNATDGSLDYIMLFYEAYTALWYDYRAIVGTTGIV